jgi:NADH-quinone oxidoreductase subunit J
MVRWLGIPLFTVFVGLLSYIVQRAVPAGPGVSFGQFTGGTPRDVGRLLFTEYLLPFEATSVLVLIAILGAVVLARKEIE